MSLNKKLLVLAGICVLAAGGIYAYAYVQVRADARTTQMAASAASPALSGNSIADGTYTVYIHSILMAPQSTSITFTHVTYFDGSEATSSAAHDVDCKKQPIETCVPTLAYGFYVRPSGAPDFTAAVTSDTKVVLKDNANATLDDVRDISRPYQPVFDVDVKGGSIQTITEKSPIVLPKQ